MSTEPGKGKGSSGGTGKGSGSSTGSSGSSSGAKKAVPASKPGRDEATVEIGPVKPTLDETTPDLGKAAPKDSEQTVTDAKIVGKDDVKPKPAGAPAPSPRSASSGPAASQASGPASPAPGPGADKPASPVIPPVKDEGGPNWNRQPEPGPGPGPGPVPGPPGPGGGATGGPAGGPGGRDKPFGRREVAGGGAPPAGSGFAGTALKDRPAAAATQPSGGGAKPAANAKAARKAQLQLARLEPWSVMKFSFVMSLVCFVVLIVAVVVLYVILSGLGVFDAISGTVDELTRDPRQTEGGLDAGNWFSFVRVFGYTVLVGALNVLLITALSTVGAVIYNLAADLVGGVEVTLKEAE